MQNKSDPGVTAKILIPVILGTGVVFYISANFYVATVEYGQRPAGEIPISDRSIADEIIGVPRIDPIDGITKTRSRIPR